MFARRLRLPLMICAAVVLAANLAWAIGFQLGESKEKLKLEYNVAVKDHGTGRVTVTLTLADEGRLKPINSADLVISGHDNTERGGYVDLSVALRTQEENGKQVARVHVLKELAKRAEIQFRTGHLDGKQEALTWYYHAIPIAKYLKENDKQKTTDEE